MTEELNLRKLFANFVNFISRNSSLLLILIAIGAVGVIGRQKLKAPYYETKAICTSGISEYERQEQIEDLSQRTAIDLINHLQINIDNEDYPALAALLGVDENIASTIKKIEAEQLYQQDRNENFYALNKFEVVLVVFDNNKINEIQNSLIYYFEHNQYIMSHYNLYKQSCSNLLEDIAEEMLELSKIRSENISGKFALSSNNTLTGKRKNLSNEIIALAHIRENIKTREQLLKPISFVQEFAKVDQMEDDILVWIVLVTVLSFIFGLFIALIREVKIK